MQLPTTENPLTTADYLLILGYFSVMLVIGFYFAGKMRSMSDFFSGGKQVPWWLSSISFWMSSFSAFAFVAHSAIAYKHGFVPITIWIITAVTMVLTAHLVAGRWRRVAITSPMEFVEARYSGFLRQALSYLGTLLIVLDDSTKILAVGLVVSASLGFPATQAILWSGLIMMTYTLLGGLWAVLITDTVQFVVMMAAVLVLVPLALARVGGLAGFAENLPEQAWMPVAGKYTVAYLVFLGLLQMLSFCTRWSLVQRFYAVPTDRDARKVCYLAAVLSATVAPLLLLPAMAASIFLPGVEDPDQIYGLLCRHLLPAGMLGMLIAAIFSATMSSLSSDYNAVASVLTTDVYRNLMVREASQGHYVLVGRVITLLVACLTIGLALAMDHLGKGLLLFDLMVIIFALFGPPTMIPVLAGLLWRRVSAAGALCGMLSGFTISFVARFLGPPGMLLFSAFLGTTSGAESLGGGISETALMGISIASTLAGLALGSLLWPGSEDKRREVNRFLDGLTAQETPPAEPATGSQAVFPLPIVGIAVAALGAMLLAAVLISVPLAQATCSLTVGSLLLFFGLGLVGISKRFVPGTT